MDIVSSYLSNLMLIVGSLFLLIGAIGLIRMPDVFTQECMQRQLWRQLVQA